MAEPLKTVAVLVANPALSSILSTTLASVPALRVRQFETEVALRAYLQLAPADLVVADFDNLPSRADRLAARLLADVAIRRKFQIIALASSLTSDIKAASIEAGIDEVILKPMSPRYLVERVLARLAQPKPRTAQHRGLNKRDWSAFGDNIVPLFEARP